MFPTELALRTCPDRTANRPGTDELLGGLDRRFDFSAVWVNHYNRVGRLKMYYFPNSENDTITPALDVIIEAKSEDAVDGVALAGLC
jgi:hypothetical protein